MKYKELNSCISGDCAAGYYCTGGAWIPDPIDNGDNETTGDICPLYHHCPEGITCHKVPSFTLVFLMQ